MQANSVALGLLALSLAGALACSGDPGSNNGSRSQDDEARPEPAPPFGDAPNAGGTSDPLGAGQQSNLPLGGEASGGNPISGAAPAPAAPADAGSPPTGAGSEPPAGGGSTPLLPAQPARLERVLVFTRTADYRHESIGAGVDALRRLGSELGFEVEQTEDPAAFSADNLAAHDVVVWLNTTSNVLDGDQESAFEAYVRNGGGWVGVHAAADTEYDWAFYGELLGGAYFLNHPEIQSAELVVQEPEHASTAHLPPVFTLTDEWYNFRLNPRPAVNVLMTLNESSYGPGEGAMGADHPIAWYREVGAGRAWYTALGHRSELYQDAAFVQHLAGGLEWAAGVVP